MILGPHDTITGPMGAFLIPSDHPETRRICEGLSRLLWDGGEYEHPEVPSEGIRTVLDIGAGWGAFAVWARKRWGMGIEIDCYEPHERGADFVEANDPRARVHRVAVTTKAMARLNVGLDWGASSVLGDGGTPVQVLHPAALPAADVLKCDAEGVEPEVLAQYRHWSSLRVLAYEWHSPRDRSLCRALCEGHPNMRMLCDRDGPWGPGNGTAIWVAR